MDTAIARVDERCASAERAGVPSEVTGQLHDRIHELAGFEAGRRFVLHGDAHRHNIVSVGGLWLFVDLDDLSVGALEHDLAPVAMACLRYHSPNFELDKVIKGYLGSRSAVQSASSRRRRQDPRSADQLGRPRALGRSSGPERVASPHRHDAV